MPTTIARCTDTWTVLAMGLLALILVVPPEALGDKGARGHRHSATPASPAPSQTSLPAPGQAGERGGHEEHGNPGGMAHVHAEVPPEYAGKAPSPNIWTDAAVLAKGKDIYVRSCLACHGERGDGKGPAAVALPVKPSDTTDQAMVAAMSPAFWFWRVMEGGLVEPYNAMGSTMPAWKGQLSEEETWAVIAYQHAFSGHRGPHTPEAHPELRPPTTPVVAAAKSGSSPSSHAMPPATASGMAMGAAPHAGHGMPAPSAAVSPPPQAPHAGHGEMAPAAPGRPPTTEHSIMMGEMTYNMSCVFCHGSGGKGDGPAAFFVSAYSAPRPRDFTSGLFKFRSTPSGQLPTDQDLFRTISEGIPGYMPAFRGLGEADRWAVVDYIKQFIPTRDKEAPRPISVGEPPPTTSESLAQGQQLYRDAECWQCHGDGGKGDGPSASTLKDDWGFPITPTDLTNPRSFKNGRSPQDVYRTLLTGLTGTPMPSYADSLAEEQAWSLAYYVLSLSGRQ